MATEVTPESFGEQVRWAREERERAGLDPSSLGISVHLPTFAFEGMDEERAWALVRPFHHYVGWKYDDMDSARSRLGPPPAAPPVAARDEASLRRSIVFGSPEAVADEIRALADAAGGDVHYIARLYWPGMDRSAQREALEVFGRRVVPLLR
jgi:alkanesulfonate monooxygenase SsuD/methylene tetrahydromethanopterin reductase-like flavin-dependent oxidoreductase (luciferase family)